jgi:hypothetical protein
MSSNTTFWGLCLLFASTGPCAEPTQTLSDFFGKEKASEPGADRAAEAPLPEGAQQTKTAKSYMRQHTAEADEMRKAARMGQLDGIHSAAAKIASDGWTANLRPDYRPHVDAVRAAAALAAEAASFESATAALGQLGAACASCHQEFGGPPAPPAAAPAARAEDSMSAHAAAEEALWVGLTFPSEASWMRGARGLLDAPAVDSDVEEVSALAHRTSDLAHDALEARSPRADVYGRILSTCSTCHTRLAVTAR